MADKQISELTAASNLTDSTLLVVEQGGSAMKANWGMMKNYISPGVAPLYSNSSTYAVGDYVLYQNTLYRCITAITTAEAWTAAHWTAAVLGDDVGDLKSAFNDISNVLSIPYSDTATGTTPQNSQANIIIDGITLESGKSYVIYLTYSTASDAISYLYLTDSQINVLNSKTISAGTTSVNVVYYAQNSYDNAKLLINSTNRALDYELTIREDAENKIDALERDKLSAYEYENATTFTFAAAATMTQPCPVKNGSVYKITVTGNASVAVNVRSGNGYAQIDDIAVDCYAGNTYFSRYTGTDAPNLLVFASGACTVTVEDISTLSGSGEHRIYATVSTVRELLECIEISHTVKMTICLMDGVYDLISGLGASYFENAPSQNFGPVLCNDVEIVGGEGAVITANYTGGNANVMTYFAAFNAGKCVYPWTLYGGFSLKNVHLEGSKIRYLVHDENNQHDIPYHNVYDGCYFYFDNSGNTSWGSQAIIGGGLGKHGYIEIKNCVFRTPTLASRSAVVSYHNSLAVGAKSHIILTGNLIAPLNAVFRLGYHGTSEEKTLVLATNNKWGGTPSVSAETSSDTVNNFDLQEWNNVVLS